MGLNTQSNKAALFCILMWLRATNAAPTLEKLVSSWSRLHIYV